MEAPNRDETEYELAAAILLLWMLCESISLTGIAGWTVFIGGFNEKVRPLLTRIYGSARTTVANQFGHQHAVSTDSQTGAVTVQIPNLTRKVDQYAQDLYQIFQRRQQKDQEKQSEADRQAVEEPEAEPVVVPKFGESEAESIAVTTTTQVHSDGEMDGAKDVESRVGHRLVGIWKTEPGACKICFPLDGTTKEWRLVFPKGPPAHPRCVLPGAMVSFPFGNTAAMRANYKGRAVEIRTESGAVLLVTEGHMIPVAPNESKRAGCIVAGEALYRLSPIASGVQRSANGLFNAATENEDFLHVRAMVKPYYFHSEGARMTGDVDMTILNPRQKFVNLEGTLARKPIGHANLVRQIPLDVVQDVRTFDYEGLVYDFSGDSLAFFAVDGVIVHNCRCHLDWRLFLE